eukprot:4606246-Pyramimonas_sp.AAC.1
MHGTHHIFQLLSLISRSSRPIAHEEAQTPTSCMMSSAGWLAGSGLGRSAFPLSARSCFSIAWRQGTSHPAPVVGLSVELRS